MLVVFSGNIIVFKSRQLAKAFEPIVSIAENAGSLDRLSSASEAKPFLRWFYLLRQVDRMW